MIAYRLQQVCERVSEWGLGMVCQGASKADAIHNKERTGQTCSASLHLISHCIFSADMQQDAATLEARYYK
jgi:hypothetical protein